MRNVKMTVNDFILIFGLKLNSLIVLWYNKEHSQRIIYLADEVSNSYITFTALSRDNWPGLVPGFPSGTSR